MDRLYLKVVHFVYVRVYHLSSQDRWPSRGDNIFNAHAEFESMPNMEQEGKHKKAEVTGLQAKVTYKKC